MNHPYRDPTVWADHRRHRADVRASYDRAEVVTIPDRELRPVAAAARSHRQLRRDAADDLRGLPRIELTPAVGRGRDVARRRSRDDESAAGRFEMCGPGPGMLVLLPFQPL